MANSYTILKIRDGEIINRKAVAKLFAELKAKKNADYTLQAKNISNRSLPQNAYLHGILIPEFRKALNSVGYDEVKTDMQAKLIMKSMFLSVETANHQTGELIKYIRNTRDLTKEELNILIEEVIKFAAENMNYQIPFPNEQLMMQYE